MELSKQLKPFKFDYKQLDQITHFYWMSEHVLKNLLSDEYSFELLPDTPGFGAHWGGVFPILKDKCGNQIAICHTGLVHHPDTETGIYFEVETFSNPKEVYEKLRRDIEPCASYDLNREEPEYLKFFYPKDRVATLMNAQSVEEQMDMLKEYLDACFLGLLKAAKNDYKRVGRRF